MDFLKKKNLITQNAAKNLDVVFLVDTSGSMSSALDAVKSSCLNFADKIIKEDKNVRLGLVGFDIGGHRKGSEKQNYIVHKLSTYTIGIWNLTTPAVFKNNIQTLTLGLFGGGGCYIAKKDTVDIFPYVAKVFDRHDNSKILVIISDEMGDNSGLSQITDLLQKEDIETYVMGVPNPKGAHEIIAQTTGGKFWDIRQNRGTQDFSELLGNVAEVIIDNLKHKMQEAGLMPTERVQPEKPRFIFREPIKPTYTFGEKTKK
ncbi:hypothetical protein FACS1894162_6060 [Bacteroidia bacterium]|nr:hypothetical protein FACS1894162_6060 [Bacteroidia bacterium]